MTSRVLRFVEIEGMSLRQLGIAYAVAGAAAASMKAILAKLAYAAAPVSPVVLLNLRMLMALPFFLWLFLRAGSPRQLHMKHWLQLALLGFAGYYFSSLSDFIGLQYVSAGLERLILFTYPSFVVLIESFWRGQRLRRHSLLAMTVSYAGLGLAFGHDLGQGQPDRIGMGSAWILASALSYALYYVGAARLIRDVGADRFAGGVGLFATGMMLAHGIATEPLAAFQDLPRSVWLSALAMALLSTVLPSWLNAKAMGLIGASDTAGIGNLGPVLTIAAGWLVLSEPFSLAQLIGMALVIFGVRQLSRQEHAAQATAASTEASAFSRIPNRSSQRQVPISPREAGRST